MSSSSMAPIPSSSWSPSSTEIEKPDFESIRELITSVNQYIDDFLAKDETRRLLKLRFISRCAKQDYFECSDQSVFSNLYGGIKSIEAAIQATRQEERTSQLRKSEEMLQVPALLDEYGFTAGIPNYYLISFSYFYLSLVRKLCRDEWQVVLHFLQAVLVSPSLARVDCAPELCACLFPSCKIVLETQEINDISHIEEDSVDEDMRQMARRYKHWLMYYQVMSHGQTPNWHCMKCDITSPEEEPMDVLYERVHIGNSSNSMEHKHSFRANFSDQKVHLFNNKKCIMDVEYETKTCREASDHPGCEKDVKGQTPNVQAFYGELATNYSIKCFHDILKESQSDSPTSEDSSYYFQENDTEANIDGTESSITTARRREYDPQQQVYDQTLENPCFASAHMRTTMTSPQAPQHSTHEELSNVNVREFLSDRLLCSIGDSDLSNSEQKERSTNFSQSFPFEDELQMIGHKTSTSPPTSMFTHLNQQGRAKRNMHSSRNQRKFSEAHSQPGQGGNVELLAVVERAVSKLCFSEGVGKCERDYAVEVTSMYKMLNQKTGETYAILKDMILDQLLTAISTSKKEQVVRASVSTLTTIISVNTSAVEEIKKKGLRLCDLASALKRNVHEAAILIYLINPAPIEIKSLELLPTLIELVCTSNDYTGKPAPPVLTPPSASLMIIEVLVTAFDYNTNNTHLAAINSPHVLSRLLDVARSNSVEEYVSLATILVKCMQFDGRCRKYISQFTTVAPFICLLRNDQKRAKFIALEYFHEILRMPRSSAISLLQRIRNEGGTDIFHILALCVRQLQPNYQLLAANLLLQLDTVVSSKLCKEKQENQKGNGVFIEETMKVILKLLASEESSTMQLLSAFILSNVGGTYSWTGEPYTVAWLVKRTGLTSPHHRNMIKNYEWADQCLEDAGIESWSSKIAKSIIEIGSPAFRALEKGLKSKMKNVSRDSLTTIAWLGYEIARSSNSLRSSACKILLSGIEQFLHPGMELEERLLACLCIYNYASGKGMKKLNHFTEGVRESLRRFSSVTWMAEELHRVAEYCLPNKSRISCVHTQILEASSKCSGAVTALIYYKGLLHSGYSDGSIKVWEIKKQSSTLVWDRKEHKKAVTCFALFEPGESLLSGSADKSIRVWQMVEGKLECIEVISMKEPIQQMETCKQMTFLVTQGHKIKVFDSQRTVKEICKHKKVKCMRLAQGKAYLGCMDSCIKELAITNNQEKEIKAPSKSWRMQSKPIHSLFLYKDWLYSASSSIVEGSNLKEWRRQSEPQMSIVTEKGRNILAMAVVEDFIYLTCSSSTSILQIWLRGAQQKVGRISAGGRITSLLTANDTIICGTEKGLIKGWIPL